MVSNQSRSYWAATSSAVARRLPERWMILSSMSVTFET